MAPSGGRESASPPGGAVFCAAVVFAVLAAVVTANLLVERPPAPVPATAPAAAFSAERAMATVRVIAGQPRPLGSPAGAAARELLVERLRGAGLATRVVTSVGVNSAGGFATIGQVHNVVATLPGTAPTGAVVLVAHHDSVAAGPGAADDGAGVAAILETIRALRSREEGSRLRNDLVVLLTDGEEEGLLGAQAFVRDDPLRGRPAVVLNWEARGTSGPSLLFQTSPGNGGLIELYGRAVPRPAGDSSLAAVYRYLPNDTDLSPFLDAGRPGLNVAFVEGAARYHTPGDAPENLSASSLQHHGSTMLALTAALGTADLRPLDPAASGAPPSGDATFFTVFGRLVTYPDGLAVPLAVGAAAVVLAAALQARRRGLLRGRALLAAVASIPLLVLVAGMLGVGVWELAVALRPAYGNGAGMLHEPLLFELAVLSAAGVGMVAWGLVGRRAGAWALGLAGAAFLAALAVATAVFVPGASFLFALPALGLGAGALAATAARGWARSALLGGGAIPLALLGSSLVVGMFAVGLSAAALAAAVTALVGAPLALLLTGIRGRWPLVGVPLVLAAALLAAGLLADRPTPAQPRSADLAYLLDADTATAHWVSRDGTPEPWASGYVPAGPRVPDPTLPWPGTTPVRTGPAPRLDLPAPVVAASRRPDGALEVQVRSDRGATTVGLRTDVAIAGVEATLDGRAPVALALGDAPAEIRIGAVPAGGARVVLRPRTPGPVRLQVYDETVGLEAVPGFVPRPPHLSRSSLRDGDTVVVTTSGRW